MAKTKIIFYHKEDYDDGFIVELKIWQLPEVTSERPHGYKYSLYYGQPGSRVIGYDNERGKGDHRHYADDEECYEFKSVRQLIGDFMVDVGKARKSQ